MSHKTSIILCTYNESKYIKNTILELEKNIPNVELIIVESYLKYKFNTRVNKWIKN